MHTIVFREDMNRQSTGCQLTHFDTVSGCEYTTRTTMDLQLYRPLFMQLEADQLQSVLQFVVNHSSARPTTVGGDLFTLNVYPESIYVKPIFVMFDSIRKTNQTVTLMLSGTTQFVFMEIREDDTPDNIMYRMRGTHMYHHATRPLPRIAMTSPRTRKHRTWCRTVMQYIR